MSEAHLMLELLSWIAARTRTYADVKEAWQSSCPRYTPWENAQIEGLVRLEGGTGTDAFVRLTERGHGRLEAARARERARA